MIGQVVSHYRVIEQIGAGGMGVVYRAEDTRLGRPLVLKFLPAALSRDPMALERFEREAKAASSMNHPGICTVYDIGEFEGQQYIAMEYPGRAAARSLHRSQAAAAVGDARPGRADHRRD